MQVGWDRREVGSRAFHCLCPSKEWNLVSSRFGVLDGVQVDGIFGSDRQGKLYVGGGRRRL